MLLELFTIDQVNEVDDDRNIFVWYCRFDVIAGLLAGNETRLSRDWYIVHENYHAQQALKSHNDPSKHLAFFSAQSRRFAMDMASLFAKLSRGEIPLDEFHAQNEQLVELIESMRSTLQHLHDPERTVQSYPNKEPLGVDDVVDPYIPGAFYQDSLWGLNLGWIDLFPTILMHRYQTCLVLQQDATAEFESLALEEFRLVETIRRWPSKPEGTMILLQSGIALSSMFLPKDHRHTMFARKILAVVEQNGWVLSDTHYFLSSCIISRTDTSLLVTYSQTPYVPNWPTSGKTLKCFTGGFQMKRVILKLLKKSDPGSRSDQLNLGTTLERIYVT